jgi:hypothetical protein
MLTLRLPRIAIKDVGATVEEVKPDFLVRLLPNYNKHVLGAWVSTNTLPRIVLRVHVDT